MYVCTYVRSAVRNRLGYRGFSVTRKCTSYDRPDRWDGSPSSQYEWITQHSPKIPVERVYLSLPTVVKIRGREHSKCSGVSTVQWITCKVLHLSLVPTEYLTYNVINHAKYI